MYRKPSAVQRNLGAPSGHSVPVYEPIYVLKALVKRYSAQDFKSHLTGPMQNVAQNIKNDGQMVMIFTWCICYYFYVYMIVVVLLCWPSLAIIMYYNNYFLTHISWSIESRPINSDKSCILGPWPESSREVYQGVLLFYKHLGYMYAWLSYPVLDSLLQKKYTWSLKVVYITPFYFWIPQSIKQSTY